MSYVLYIVSSVVVTFLSVVQLAMLIRAILSWFPLDSNKFIDFLHGFTEPFIYPIRRLFEKLNWFQNSPIDFSFTATFLLISIIILLL